MTKASVTKLYPSNAAKNPDNVLEQAIGEYESLIVVGYDNSGDLVGRASTNILRKDILWMVEQFKLMILDCEEVEQ